MTSPAYHIPALLPQCLKWLDIKPGGTYVDVTMGGGGHTRAILDALGPDGHLYGFDQDKDAVANAPGDGRFTMVLANFRFLSNFMAFHDVDGVDGVLADLGVSFHHFDDESRGFSFRWNDAPLDMRMNRSGARPAAELLDTAPEGELADWFHMYGEVPNARRLARDIVKAREGGKRFEKVGDLLDVVRPLVNPRNEKKYLACVFQALRIVVNGEMDALKQMLEGALEVLKPGGRLAVITYHSLEDRLVKQFMKTGRFGGDENINHDIYGASRGPFKVLTAKPIVPDQAEVERNPRSRSAKLRVAVKR